MRLVVVLSGLWTMIAIDLVYGVEVLVYGFDFLLSAI